MRRPAVDIPAVTLAALLVLAPGLRADVIRIADIDRTVTITDIREGLVIYRARGSEREEPLERITAIRLTKYPAFAEAVALTAEQPARAAKRLGELVKKVREPHLKPLIHLRRAAALDRAGRFVEALGAYRAAVELDDHAYFVKRAPANLPTDAERRAAARRAVERLLADQDNEAVAERLKPLLDQLAKAPAPATAAPPAQPDKTTAPEGVAVAATGSGGDRHIKSLIDAKKYEQAIARINRALEAPRAPLADLYYQRGLVEAAMKRHVPAALSFLRTASLFPDHPLADDALLQAGAALQRAGKVDAARRVWALGLQRTNDAALTAKFRSMIRATPAP